jgi:hypothetical protein
MPPRRSARVAAVMERQSSALAPLPHALALAVFALLPVDQRLRCREVCRGWRAVLTEDLSLWRCLDLSSSGVSPSRVVTDGLLRAAAARAAGHLETLDVSGCAHLSHAALMAVVTANSVSLRQLHLRFGAEVLSHWAVAEVEVLLRAAPRLLACHAAVYTSEVAVARAMLRAEPPFTALRLESLSVGDFENDDTVAADEVVELAGDLSACSFIRELDFWGAVLDVPALDALVVAALARRFQTLRLVDCDLSAVSVPALARLLGGGVLTKLAVYGGGRVLLDAPAAAVLAHALRACSTLTVLALSGVQLWHDRGAATLLGALTGHARLCMLDLSENGINAADRAAAGAALGALVAANAPALTELRLADCDLGDAGLRPLFDALPANTHLQTLHCHGNDVTDAFVCDALLPAVRANGSLRQLRCTLQVNASAAATRALAEAEALVARRAARQ